jgi:dTDP-4-dehydrorhamnose reductase
MVRGTEALMDKLLIVGVESLCGSNLALALEDRFSVCGVSREGSFRPDGLETVVLRRDDVPGLTHHVTDLAPRWIVYCPLTAVSSWDLDPAVPSIVDESAAARALADWSAANDARLTLLSTDAVFAGPRMFHMEDSPAAARGIWPDAARRMEQAVAGTGALVVRSHVFGWSPQEDSFAEQVWSACTDRRAMAVDGRRHASPLLITDLADSLIKAYRAELQGLRHVAGSERLSPFRFACELAAALGLPGPQAAKPSPTETDSMDRAETSLSSLRAQSELDLSLPLLREGMQRFAAQAENGWRDRLRGEAWEPTVSPRRAA